MAENDTSSVINENTKQENTTDNSYKLTFVHQLIEVLVGSVALITPVILLFLWVYRVEICNYYDLPTFYSSISIIRFLPFFVFSIGVGLCIGIQYVVYDSRDRIISVEIIDNSQERNKEQAHNDEPIRGESRIIFEIVLAFISGLFLTIVPHLVLVAERQHMLNGTYPVIVGDEGPYEAWLVLVFAFVLIVKTLMFLIEIIKKYISSGSFLEGEGFYKSRRFDTHTIRVSFLKSWKISLRQIVAFFIFYFLLSLYLLTAYLAVYFARLNTDYYLVDVDDVQYAVVLDTDDYYIGEPIQITQINDGRELTIYTNSYIYLDKAENPLVVRKESFNSVMISHEERPITILQENEESVKEGQESGTEEAGKNNTTENAKNE